MGSSQMWSWWNAAVVLVAVALMISGGYGYPAEDLVVGLPGQPAVSFRQYAGYVDVDVEKGRSFFYYFVEADSDPDHKPLTLWFNGGPGCSSVGGGAFTELGPFFPQGDGRGLRINPQSWNKESNLLFVESPAGTGWSYANTTSDIDNTDTLTTKDTLAFMVGWYKKFPAFRTRDLFLAGESYAGHYIPHLAVALLDHNEHSSDFKFNIKGVAIGNPMLNIRDTIAALYEFYWSHGVISDEAVLAVRNNCQFDHYLFKVPESVSDTCNKAMSEAENIVGRSFNPYDVILDVCDSYSAILELQLGKSATKMSHGVDVCMGEELEFYFNLPEVQKAFHANRTNLSYSWKFCNHSLHDNYNTTDIDMGMLPLLKKIVQNKVPVWIFSGDQDLIVPLTGSRKFVRELANDLEFNTTVPYGAWFHEEQVGGWATEYGNLLTFATVRGAGHEVPLTEPSRALHLFSSFLRGQRLPTTRS